MRVLLVYKDYAPVVGGIEGHIQLLAEGLRERGVDARALVTNTNSHTVRETINSVPVLKAGRIASVSSAPLSSSFYSHLARESRDADVVHLHFPYPPAEVGQLLLRRGKHFVLTYHSDIVRQKYLGLLYRPLLWRVLQAADGIIVSNSQYIASSPFLRMHVGKTRVIPFGIDLAQLECTPAISARAAQIRALHRAPLILAVGKLRHYKGFDVLIRAVTEIPEAQVLIVGSGPQLREWQGLAVQLGLSDRVSFLGELSQSELVAHYYAADLFALPSTNRAETWGFVQIEAMACGLPVICTELGTGTSFVNENGVTGLVVPPRDPPALADALGKLLGQPALRREMGQSSKERAHRLFSKELMIDRILNFYSTVSGARATLA